MTLKVGDRVRVTENTFSAVPVGALGTVSGMENAERIYVDLDDHPDPLAGVFPIDGWAYLASEVEKVEVAA